DVHRLVVGDQTVEDADDRGREAALRKVAVALHEEDNLVRADQPVELGALTFGEGHADSVGTTHAVSQARRAALARSEAHQAYASGACPPGPGQMASRRFNTSSGSFRASAWIASSSCSIVRGP